MKSANKTTLFATCLLAAAALGGCQSEPVQPQRSLVQTPACCDNPSALPYKQLSTNQSVSVEINEEDPVYPFASGNSYVESIALPETGATYLLQIDSYFHHPKVGRPPQVLFPTFTLLDQAYQPIETLDALPFELVKPLFSDNSLRMVITMDSRYAAARYILIYTTEQRLHQALARDQHGQIVQGSGYKTIIYAPQQKEKLRYRFSNYGRIGLLAYPLAG